MAKDVSADQFAGIARTLRSQQGVAATLENACTTATTIIDQCDHAGVVLVGRGTKVKMIVSTDPVIDVAYELQAQGGDGPLVQTVHDRETAYVPDLRAEHRWWSWSSRVVEELELRSMLSLPLFTGTRTFGTLDLFSRTPDAFGPDERTSPLALAAHVAVATSAAQQWQDMESALLSRTVIGRAEGRLMESAGLAPDEAFAVMVRASQARNIKLVDIATDIVQNGVDSDLFDRSPHPHTKD